MIQNLEQHYKALGLEPGASLEEVNQAYKDLVFIWHPDRLPQENERLIQKSVEKLQQINEARDSLRSYHRTNKKAQTPRPSEPKTYSSSSYYRAGYSTSNSDPYSTNNQARYSRENNRQRTYSRPNSQQTRNYQRTQQSGPWDYRAYYSTSSDTRDRQAYPQGNRQAYSQDNRQAYSQGNRKAYSQGNRQTSSRDGYQDFHEYGKHSSTRQAENSCKRPYYKDLRGADLSRSNFKERDFSCRDLSQANLSHADLSDSFLHKIILEEANLEGANLKGANLLQANLRGANLKEANLIGADLSGSDLSGADLRGAKVGFKNKIMVKITAVKLTGATLPDGSIHP